MPGPIRPTGEGVEVRVEGLLTDGETMGQESDDLNFTGVSYSTWHKYETSSSPFRTWLTGQMIDVKDLLVFLASISASDVTDDVLDRLRQVKERVHLLVHNLQSPYFDNGSLSLLGLERLQNLLFRVGHGSMLRVNINMTDANKLDPSGHLGTAFRYSVLQWLQKEFGIRHVSQNPEGTSFLAINVGPHEISCSMRRFAHEIKYMLRHPEMQRQYDFDPRLLANFEPDATSMFMTLSTLGLEVEEILKSGDRQMILGLQNQIITYIEESLRLLAVGTTLIEKEGPEKFGVAAMYGGLSVFNAADLPTYPDMTGYERLQMGLRIGMGYVPPAEYRSPMDERSMTPAAQGKLAFHPRYAHNFGLLFTIARGKIISAIDSVLDARGDDEKEAAVASLKEAVEWFTIVFTIGDIARTNPRNHLFSKWIQQITLDDGSKRLEYYFFEDVSLRPEPRVHMIVAEIDSFKAFSLAYPVDETDSSFWGLFDQFFWVAKARNIDRPVITQMGGDLVAIALPTVDKTGNPVDLNDYIARVQKRIQGVYGNKLFQDYAKVEVKNGHGIRVERRPLWRAGESIVPAENQPEGSEPFRRTLSLTMIGSTVPTPRSPMDISPFFNALTDLAVKVDELKVQTAPHKGQFRIVTQEQITMPVHPQPQIMGYYVPRETLLEGVEVQSFISEVDSNLNDMWGEEWKNVSASTRQDFIMRLATHFRPGTHPALTLEVARRIFWQMGVPMPNLRPINMLLAPSVLGFLHR